MATTRDELTAALAEHVGVPALTPAEIESCLELAGAAAHGAADRTAAPLASFLAGIAAAGSADRRETLERIRSLIVELTPAG